MKNVIYNNIDIHNCYDIIRDKNGVEMFTRIPEYVRENLSPIGMKYTANNTA